MSDNTRGTQSSTAALERLSDRAVDLTVFSLAVAAVTALALAVLRPGSTQDMEPEGPGQSVDIDEDP